MLDLDQLIELSEQLGEAKLNLELTDKDYPEEIEEHKKRSSKFTKSNYIPKNENI